MYRHFDASFFVANRQRLKTLFTGTAPIILTAAGQLQRNGDTTYPFRQDSNFWYLTGINDPDVVLVMDKGKEYLIAPQRESIMEVFDGKIEAEALKQVSGISTVYSEKEGWKKLNSRLARAKSAATFPAPAPYIESYGFYTNPARARLMKRLKEANPSLELLNLQPHFIKMRMVKQEPELAAIQAAIDITVKTLKSVRRKQLDFEYEYEAAITAGFRKRGAGHGYGPVVAAGKHACTLHHMLNDGPVQPGDLLLLDVGAEVENYSADITRTYAVGDTLTKRQRAVYQAVADAHDYACSLIKPGVTIRDNEKLMEQFIGEKLRELGLIKTISRESVREYYPHALSHSLGLDTHDLADYDMPLEPGMVITVEPGIYIPAEGIGVRIEDDVVLTANGMRNMSAALPREAS